jgi:hypothetical protein
VPAARTDRRLLLAAAAIGVVAGAVGIGASIVGVDDDREGSPSTTTTAPSADDPADPPSSSLPGPPVEEQPPAEDPAGGEPTEEEEAAIEAQLEAEAEISRAQAEEIAQGQVAGPIDRSTISDESGAPVWEVRIDTDSGHTDVMVDATTGEVLSIDD